MKTTEPLIFFHTFNSNAKEVYARPRTMEVIKKLSDDNTHVHTTQQHLIALDAVLFDLVKLAFELSLAFQTLLSPPCIDDFPIDLLPIHFINCLKTRGSSVGATDRMLLVVCEYMDGIINTLFFAIAMK